MDSKDMQAHSLSKLPISPIEAAIIVQAWPKDCTYTVHESRGTSCGAYYQRLYVTIIARDQRTGKRRFIFNGSGGGRTPLYYVSRRYAEHIYKGLNRTDKASFKESMRRARIIANAANR